MDVYVRETPNGSPATSEHVPTTAIRATATSEHLRAPSAFGGARRLFGGRLLGHARALLGGSEMAQRCSHAVQNIFQSLGPRGPTQTGPCTVRGCLLCTWRREAEEPPILLAPPYVCKGLRPDLQAFGVSYKRERCWIMAIRFTELVNVKEPPKVGGDRAEVIP